MVEKYFRSERLESLFFIAVGLVAIIVAGYFFIIIKEPFYSGAAYSLILIAFIQVVVGTCVYIRSPKDIERVQQFIQSDVSKIASEEIPRMNTVMKNFQLYKYVELLLIVVGFFLFAFIDNPLLCGIGMGLVIQSSLMLILDLIAVSRGSAYMDYLKTLK